MDRLLKNFTWSAKHYSGWTMPQPYTCVTCMITSNKDHTLETYAVNGELAFKVAEKRVNLLVTIFQPRTKC
jgi:hypothetical protein